MKKRSATAPITETAMHQQTPYAGLDAEGRQVETGPHVLVSGPTGGGKTLRVLVPGALLWRGPRVLVSSKTDFMKQTVTRGLSARGATMVMDLADAVDWDAPWLRAARVQRVLSDPTTLIDGDDAAVDMATLLMQTGSLGASDSGSGGGGGGDDAFWRTLATQPLAALLVAARASGGGIAWATRAVGRPTTDPGHESEPSWPAAIDLIGDSSRHAAALEDLTGTEQRQRDSVTATMRAGLAPFIRDSVTGGGGRPFDPAMLEGSGEPTLHIIAPATGVAAGAAVAVVETIIRHWRKGVERGLPRVLLAVDELCNTCPLPGLPHHVTEARGLGVAIIAAVQSSHQLELRWGETGARVLRETFPAALVLEGAPEKELLEAAAWWVGERDVQRESIDDAGRRTITTEHVPALAAQDLRPHSLEEGRLLLHGQAGHMVRVPGIWDFKTA